MNTTQDMPGEAPFTCPNCGKELGSTNGTNLIIDEVIFTESAKLTCPRCLQPYDWHPTTDTSDAQTVRPAGQGSLDSTIARKVRQIEHQRTEAYINRDIATLKRILPDYFVFTRSLGLVFNKNQLLAALESGELVFEHIDRHIEEVNVHLNSAVALGRDVTKGRYLERDISGSYRFSNMYVEREPGIWVVVATHGSLIAGQEAAATPGGGEES